MTLVREILIQRNSTLRINLGYLGFRQEKVKKKKAKHVYLSDKDEM